MRKQIMGGAVVAALVGTVLVSGGGAEAARLITGHDIKNESVTGRDIKNESLGLKDFNPLTRNLVLNNKGDQGPKGDAGTPGAKGDKGDPGAPGMLGAYYSVAKYDVGDTNAGAIATVACSNVTDVAISGGVQVLGLGDGANSRNTPVSSSFPGRMDWATNTPKADRLDGWIVQFGGNAGAESDKAPEKVNVWALCLPGANVPVVTTYTQSAD